MLKRAKFACITVLFIYGCHINKTTYWETEKIKVSNCYNSWIYEDLQTEQRIKVLLYNPKYSHDLFTYPNFLIGENTNGDTVALLDKDFKGIILPGDIVAIKPRKWSDGEKTINKPLLTIREKSSENKLYCIISTVYFGEIKM